MEEKDKIKKGQSVEKPLFGLPMKKDFVGEITAITEEMVQSKFGEDQKAVVKIEYFNQSNGNVEQISLWQSSNPNSKWGVFNMYLKNALEPFGLDIYDVNLAAELIGRKFVFRWIQKRFGNDRATGEPIITGMLVPIRLLPLEQQSQPEQKPAQPTQPATTEQPTNQPEAVKEQPKTEEKQQTTLITTPSKEEEDNVTQHILEILKAKGPMIMGEIVLEFSKEPKWQFIPADVIFGKIADLMEKDIVKMEGNKIRMQ